MCDCTALKEDPRRTAAGLRPPRRPLCGSVAGVGYGWRLVEIARTVSTAVRDECDFLRIWESRVRSADKGGELLVVHQGPAQHEVRRESMSLQDDLSRLSQLRNSGALTEEEFVAAKAALLQDPTSQFDPQRAFWTRPRIALATAAALVICAAFIGVGMALASRSHNPQTSATGAISGASTSEPASKTQTSLSR